MTEWAFTELSKSLLTNAPNPLKRWLHVACASARAWTFAHLGACACVRTCMWVLARVCVACVCVRACARIWVSAYGSSHAREFVCVLPAHAWIHIRACTSAHPCIYTSVCVCVHQPVGVCVSTCLRVCASMSAWVVCPRVCAWLRVCVRVRVYVCLRMCAHAYANKCARVYANECADVPLRTCECVCVRKHLRELTCTCACRLRKRARLHICVSRVWTCMSLLVHVFACRPAWPFVRTCRFVHLFRGYPGV